MWLSKTEQWDALAAAMRKAGEYGIDAETYNQPDRTSPQHRARIHCWSVGVLRGDVSARGFRRAVGVVLPRIALEHRTLRAVLADPTLTGFAHNAGHDIHSLRNEGVEVANIQDSLQWARVAVPGMQQYGLKEIERWALGYPPRPSFLDMVTYQFDVVTARGKNHKACICGAVPCKAKSTSDWLGDDGVWRPHIRVRWRTFTPQHRFEKRRIEVPEFVPGAKLPPLVWGGKTLDRLEAFWDYSKADAVRGIEAVDWLRNQKRRALVYPWQVQI